MREGKKGERKREREREREREKEKEREREREMRIKERTASYFPDACKVGFPLRMLNIVAIRG